MAPAAVNNQFSLEFLRLETLRARLLAGLFLLGIPLAALGFLYYRKHFEQHVSEKGVLQVIILFLMGITVFQAGYLVILARGIKKGRLIIPFHNRFINATLEAISPSVILYCITDNFQNPVSALHSPLIHIYYIFILLSTLRLNRFLSIWMGAVSALSYLGICLYTLHQTQANLLQEDFTPRDPMGYIAKSVVMLFCGFAAAFVATQIRGSITRAVEVIEKEGRLITLFGRQAPMELVQEMLLKDKAPSKLAEICVMFIDVRNFTPMVGRKPPDEILRYQKAFFNIIIHQVKAHRGFVHQFLGDGCMVLFGAPEPLENPAERAVSAAMAILKAIEAEQQRGGLPPTQIGIGMAYGQVVSGILGNEVRQQYSVTGSVVIKAARIEQLNKEYRTQILASAEVLHQAKLDKKSFTSVGEVNLKGWDEPVEIFRLA